MIILGIHDGHNSGATIIKDGEILASVLEERLTRKKMKKQKKSLFLVQGLLMGKVQHQRK